MKKRSLSVERADSGLARLLDALAGGDAMRREFCELWRNWKLVMGDDIALLAVPLGHRDRRLLVGAEDGMAMTELGFLREEMVARANAFFEKPWLEECQIMALQGRKGLDRPPEADEEPAPPAPRPAERPTGRWLAEMDPDSPVARCYRSFAGLDGRDGRNAQDGQRGGEGSGASGGEGAQDGLGSPDAGK
ncbi:MAG: DUF721 domain-containing protein [Desulfovibrio sp.]|nr:DUF721 domain-containing protein [Desulfovibrio sp.]